MGQGLAAQMFNGIFMSVGLRIPIMCLYGGSEASKAYRRIELVFTVVNRERQVVSFIPRDRNCWMSQEPEWTWW
jgi:hypothetical protein